MWPVVNSLQNLVAIGSMAGNRAKKLIEDRQGGFLIPIVNKIAQEGAFASNSPRAVILCPSWRSVQVMTELCVNLGDGNKNSVANESN